MPVLIFAVCPLLGLGHYLSRPFLAKISGCDQSRKASHIELIEFSDLVSNPHNYHGKNICAEGAYLLGFEVSALGASTYQQGSAVYLTEPVIWIEGADIRSSTDCFKTDTTPPAEFCQATVCGLFETGGNYGHLGAYKFQIRGGV